jgi:enolase-phosphatase E1
VNGAPGAVLLDVEGTTTPVDFVYRILFPYARERVPAFLEARGREAAVRAIVEGLREEHGKDAAAGRQPPSFEAPNAVAGYARWLIDQDRKATPLKTLQGLIWEEGFRNGDLRGQVYDDVPKAFERWQAAGRRMAIFSSGSVLAQRLLFGHTAHGDLTPLIAGYFDTTTGPKKEAATYGRIAAAIGRVPADVRFVSDVGAEVDAARAAGLRTALCVREGAPAPPGGHRVIRSFDELD